MDLNRPIARAVRDANRLRLELAAQHRAEGLGARLERVDGERPADRVRQRRVERRELGRLGAHACREVVERV
jgi:hypothetical protein